jgi:hypothetical protein
LGTLFLFQIMTYVKKDEFSEQKALCEYLSLQYPDVIFASDLSGIRLPQGLANKIKSLKCRRGIPDLFIYEARRGYFGLAIELKATGVTIYKQDGNLKTDQHLMEQEDMLKRLNEKGYLACFCIGYSNAKAVIDEYLSKKYLKSRHN